MQLEELMSVDADIVLEFEDGKVSVNSTHLRMCSKVLGHAMEAAAAGTSAEGTSNADAASSGTKKRLRDSSIPVPGVKKHEWMVAASFLYPVAPRPVITGWDQLAIVLHVGSSLDIPLLLELAASYLTRNSSDLGDSDATQSVWKWLTLADKAGLNANCMGSLTRRAAYIDRAGCKHTDRMEGLSPCVLKQLVVAIARDARIPPTNGAQRFMPCQNECVDWHYHNTHCGTAPHQSHTLLWVCDSCNCPIRPPPVRKDNGY